MKSKLRFKFLVFFYTSYLSIPSFLTSQPFFSTATVVRVGNDCTGYLLPETNYIWTLNQCLEYENTHGINSIKSKISIQKNISPKMIFKLLKINQVNLNVTIYNS